MCTQGLQSQCETTQVKKKNSGAALFGFSELYGSVPGGQAEYLRVPYADYGPVKVEREPRTNATSSSRTFFPRPGRQWNTRTFRTGGTLAVLGLGPVGQFAARIGAYKGFRVIGVDPVPERRAMAAAHGIETMDYSSDVAGRIREQTLGRGPDSVVDAVGMEAHGSPCGVLPHKAVAPPAGQAGANCHGDRGVDRLAALHTAVDPFAAAARSRSAGSTAGRHPMPLMTMFDKQIQLRMGQCNVRQLD